MIQSFAYQDYSKLVFSSWTDPREEATSLRKVTIEAKDFAIDYFPVPHFLQTTIRLIQVLVVLLTYSINHILSSSVKADQFFYREGVLSLDQSA